MVPILMMQLLSVVVSDHCYKYGILPTVFQHTKQSFFMRKTQPTVKLGILKDTASQKIQCLYGAERFNLKNAVIEFLLNCSNANEADDQADYQYSDSEQFQIFNQTYDTAEQ